MGTISKRRLRNRRLVPANRTTKRDNKTPDVRARLSSQPESLASLDRCVEIFWPDDGRSYAGVITAFVDGMTTVCYDIDGDSEILDLSSPDSEEVYEWLDVVPPGPEEQQLVVYTSAAAAVPAAAASAPTSPAVVVVASASPAVAARVVLARPA